MSMNQGLLKDSSQIKHLNTETLLHSFDRWHTSFQSVLKEHNELREDIGAAALERHRLTDANQKMKNELDAVHEMVKSSSNHLERICTLEDENRELSLQSTEMEVALETLQKQLSEEKQTHIQALQQTKEDVEERMAKINERLKTEASIERELLQRQVSDRERDLEEAEDNLKQLQNSKDAELSRVSLEYEGKLARLQRQKALSNQNQTSSANSDIFRKKLQNMKNEYETELSRLRQTIAGLEQRLAETTNLQTGSVFQQTQWQRQTMSMGKRKRTA
ncbi:coiled-coil domain-containing protein 152-like [Haliotis rubra]|uniref:coiled-coil domain-containing protein 152-like n=1 Tax=Haliotis rubra TaxID=36100 RepID=UPI001EE5E6AB|nr:coiled-coil domain-containing protein 152-like [Haliotis rubra]